MSTQENETGFGRLIGGNGADYRRRLNESADHAFGANKPSEAAKRQAAGLVPDRGPVTLSPMSKKGRSSEDASKGTLEFAAHGNRWPSPHRTDSIRSQDSSAGSTTTRSSTFPNTMSDSVGSLYMDTAPASPTFDECSYSIHSNMTSMNTSPNTSRKNTIDERLDDFVLEGNEVKRAKTEHYGTSAASTQMATDVLAHFPTHTKSFPLTNTYLVDRTWPELMYMQPDMDHQWKNDAPRRPTSGFLALTPEERATDSRASPLFRILSTDLPFRSMKFSNPDSDPAPDKYCSQDQHSTADLNCKSPCTSNNTPATPTPAPSNLHNTPSPPPKTEGSPIFVACDSYGDAYYDVMRQEIHNLILEHTPTAVLEDLEKPLKMVAVWCTEQAINMIQGKLCNISCAEEIVIDCSKESLEDSGSGSHAPSHAAPASESQNHAPAKGHGELSNHRGDDYPEDDTNKDQDQERSITGRHDYRRVSKRDRNGLSCPFRKRNPLRFNIRDWSNCALQPFDNITLLKLTQYCVVCCALLFVPRRHIKNCHALNQSENVCMRCRKDMSRSESLKQHLTVPKERMCEIATEAPIVNPEDGITREIDEKLCARGNARKVDCWAALWRTLFPNDEHPPSQDFDPPVGLEEVVNKFDCQNKEPAPMGEGWPPLRAKLHDCLQANDFSGADPIHSSSLVNNVCQEYINETLKICAHIPNEKNPYVDGPSANSPSRPITMSVRASKKPGRTATSPTENPVALPPLASNSPASILPHPPLMNPVDRLPISLSPPFPDSRKEFGPYPGHQNLTVGAFINHSATNLHSGPPSLSNSTISSGSGRRHPVHHGLVTPRLEPEHAAGAQDPSPTSACQAGNSPHGQANYSFSNMPFPNPSVPRDTDLSLAPSCLYVPISELVQPQTDAEEVMLDPVMPDSRGYIDNSASTYTHYMWMNP
ncbi:hypothetical protein PspLS_02678 [Pyricularia sp. CBS 133598]|nr:hypothetical protein PspLS_02678 [Pyricularia sp. CBS 133598]